MAKYQPFVNLGPGDSIKEDLAYYVWDQKALAEILGKTEKHISSLLNKLREEDFPNIRWGSDKPHPF